MAYTPHQVSRWMRRRIESALTLFDIGGSRAHRSTLPPVQAIEPEIEPMPAPAGYVAVCGIMKNEAQNILEWIGYHAAMGVERFYLYDNNSTDDVLNKLQPLIDIGLVDYTFWPHNPGQIQAYDDCVAKHRDEWTWIAFIDLDELINPFGYESIPQWLSKFEDFSAVAIQWLNFGPSGHDHPPAGLMIENYLYRLPDEYNVHGHVKTIAKAKDYVRAISPHAMETTGVIVDEFLNPVQFYDGVEYSIQPVLNHRDVCVNHYYTRSRSEWIGKVTRGLADNVVDAPIQRNPAWLEIYERDATVFDNRILKYADITAAELMKYGIYVERNLRSTGEIDCTDAIEQ